MQKIKNHIENIEEGLIDRVIQHIRSDVTDEISGILETIELMDLHIQRIEQETRYGRQFDSQEDELQMYRRNFALLIDAWRNGGIFGSTDEFV